jgi:triacylglycerol lipase
MYFPNGFSIQRAVQLAELVNQAYSQLEAFQQNREWSPSGGYALVSELSYTGTRSGQKSAATTNFDKELKQFAVSPIQQKKGLPIGFIAECNREIFLVFRGTMTNAEWLQDFNIRLTSYPGGDLGKVHDGFLRTYVPFQQAIRESLSGKLRHGGLYITGHSLGAGLATMAAADLSASRVVESPNVYTFASPRVGDNQFALKYNELIGSRSFRIANTCDIVTSIPFPVPFLNFIGGYFTHVDTPVEFTSQKEDAGKNHGMNTYLEALKSARQPKGLFRMFLKQAPEFKVEVR